MSHRAAQLFPYLAKQFREFASRSVSSHFVVLHPLASRDEKRHRAPSLFGVQVLSALFEDAFNCGTGFARHLLSEKFADLFKARDLAPGLFEVVRQPFLQLGCGDRFDDFLGGRE